MRWQLACLAALTLVAPALGHFVYILPASDGKEVLVVFSDTLGPDEKVKIDKIAVTKLLAFDSDGKPMPLSWAKAENALRAPLGARGPRHVTGYTDYGVANSKHTGNIPVLIKYHSKAMIGKLETTNAGPSNELAFEVVPLIDAGKLRFMAAQKGKAVAKASCVILAPGAAKGQRATTDAKGYLPGEFDNAGRYGVWVRFVDSTPGEWQGKKYDKRHDYATLVVDFNGAGR